MGISSAGLGSGLDVNGLVTQLLALERQPLNSLNKKKQVVNDQVSAYGRVKSDLDAFKTAMAGLKLNLDFQGTKAKSSNTELLTATSGNTAVAGSYDIKINTLAQAGVSASQGKSAAGAAIGVAGSMAFAVGDKAFSINVESTDTLQTVSSKINAAMVSGETSAQTLAKASVINAGTSAAPSYKLVIASTGKGVDNNVAISFDDPSLEAYFGLSSSQAATNASFVVNGLPVERASNTVTDVVDGVTLNLTAADPAKTLNLTVSRDTEAITKKVNDFISAYNKLAGTISSLHQKGGTLEADNSAKSVIYGLQNEFNQPANLASSSYNWLSEIGVSFKKDGTLGLDSTTFNKALETKFDDVMNLFADSERGFAHRLYNTAADMLDTNGLVSSKISGLNSRIKTFEVGMDRENLRLTNIETRLRSQYARLDAALGTMKNTSSYLTSQLG